MTTKFRAGFSLCFALALLASGAVQAQTVYVLQPDSKVWVDGTSNKSDWTVEATTVHGTMTMDDTVAGLAREVHVTVPVVDMKSGRSTIMDRLIRDALKAEEHPEIVYELTSIEPVEAASTAPSAPAFTTQGRLTIGGATRDVAMTVQGVPQKDGTVRFTGTHSLRMTDYDLTPPTAMFGALHTGDEVTVRFDVVAAPKK